MSELPDTKVTLADMFRWYEMVEQLDKLKLAEVTLRKRIFGDYFPPDKRVEGTNTAPLDDGYALKGTYKIDRKVDEAALTTLAPTFREQAIPLDSLIKYKPELSVKEYRKLEGDTSEEGKKRLHLFDQCLIIKPSETPALEIVLPAKAAKK